MLQSTLGNKEYDSNEGYVLTNDASAIILEFQRKCCIYSQDMCQTHTKTSEKFYADFEMFLKERNTFDAKVEMKERQLHF